MAEDQGLEQCQHGAEVRPQWRQPRVAPALLPIASRPLLERANCAQEVDFAELRPIDVGEVEFAVDALP